MPAVVWAGGQPIGAKDYLITALLAPATLVLLLL
jgi:hypothetical protein